MKNRYAQPRFIVARFDSTCPQTQKKIARGNASLDIGRKNNPGMYGTADRIPDPVENATPAPAGWGSVQS